MKYLLSIVTPSIGILLSESPAHIEHYEHLLPEQLKNHDEKDQLDWLTSLLRIDDGLLLTTKALQTAIVDASDLQTYSYIKKQLKDTHLFSTGSTDEHDIIVHFHEVTLKGTTFGFQVHTHQYKEYITLFLPHMALPYETGGSLACAILTAIHLGVTPQQAAKVLETSFSLPPGRGTIFEGIHDSIILDSSYNASPASVYSFLHLLKELKKSTKRKTLFIMGDMKELGSYTEYAHRLIARELPDSCDNVMLVGPFTKQFMLPYLEKHKAKFSSIVSFNDVNELHEYLINHEFPHTLLLFKGSQLLEEAIKPLLVHKSDVTYLCRQDEFWQKSKIIRKVWMG